MLKIGENMGCRYNALPFSPPGPDTKRLMERLIEYVTHHPLMAAAVVLALAVVLTYESRVRATTVGAVSTQDLIRLMNQGALVLDIRKPEEFAAGHVNGAKQLPSDQILTAGENFKRSRKSRWSCTASPVRWPLPQSASSTGKASPRRSRCAAALPAGARKTCPSSRLRDE